MNEEKLKRLLKAFKKGEKTESEILDELRAFPFEDIGFAKPDHHRHLRTGFPEVVLGEGKSKEQILAIAARLAARGGSFMVTRCPPEVARDLLSAYPMGSYYEQASLFALPGDQSGKKGYILVITAGTSDIPAAEEAAVTAELFGCNVDRIYDVGVAGIHRLLAYRSMIDEADVIIVAAGMEGALASVVASMSKAPVIALPTSVGYGANFRGLSALLGMLNSCAPGVSVVNVDNGFGAGCSAAMIVNKARELAGKIGREDA